MANTYVAQEIINQLGGNRFAVMTGAKDFVATDNGVRFCIGKNGSKANLVVITLTEMDDYTVEFWRKGRAFNEYTLLTKCYKDGMNKDEFNAAYAKALEKAKKAAKPTLLHSVIGVFCDTLQETFTDYTKLYTRLF